MTEKKEKEEKEKTGGAKGSPESVEKASESEEELEEILEKEEEKEEEEITEPPSEKEETEEEPKAPSEEKEEEKEEEEKKEKEEAKRKREEEEEIVEERIYTVPLSRAWIMPPNKRSPRAVRILRAFIKRHMKVETPKEGEEEEGEEPAKLVISNEVNERIWIRGIQKPPRNIRVRAAKDKDGNVTVYLAEGD